MNIFSQLRTRLGYFLLSHVLTREVLASFASQGNATRIDETPWPTQTLPAFFPASGEQNTDSINEHDLEVALQTHRETREVPGLHRHTVPLNVDMDTFKAKGDYMRWYHRAQQIERQDTVEISAIALQEELLKRLGEG